MSPAESDEILTVPELREMWRILSSEERLEAFALLTPRAAQEFFLSLSSAEKAEIISNLSEDQQKLWIRLLPPDDMADLVQESSEELHAVLLSHLDSRSREEVHALLSYKQDVAGGLMNPRFARVRPDLTVDEAIRYVRLQAQDHMDAIYYVFVLDEEQHLLGVLSFHDLFRALPQKTVREVMRADVVTVTENMDQEIVGRMFAEHKYLALPVVDSEKRIKGIITADDILQTVETEATEDIQKMGGMEALDAPYMRTGFFEMFKKRAGWLIILFIGELLTATAMSHFEHEIARAVVLALFVPLIISSGGNCGSQATTLIIRALALGEVRLRDWWRVMKRELAMGFGLGLALGIIGFFRIIIWQAVFDLYGPHYFLVALSVSISLVGVVVLGTLAGSMLPFILRRLKFDPASASAPFVATLVDVSGIVIYFSASAWILRGTLL